MTQKTPRARMVASPPGRSDLFSSSMLTRPGEKDGGSEMAQAFAPFCVKCSIGKAGSAADTDAAPDSTVAADNHAAALIRKDMPVRSIILPPA